MSTHNKCFRGEIRKILCGYPLLSVAMIFGPHISSFYFQYGCTLISQAEYISGSLFRRVHPHLGLK